MNNKILFRGFRPDKNGETVITVKGEKIRGEWVKGYYSELPVGSIGATIFANSDEVVCEDTDSFIISITTKQCSSLSPANPLEVVEAETIKVIPETVGQFVTTDKNGKDVFEGDKVFCKARVSYSDSFNAIVGFNDMRLSFIAQEDDGTYIDDLSRDRKSVV